MILEVKFRDYPYAKLSPIVLLLVTLQPIVLRLTAAIKGISRFFNTNGASVNVSVLKVFFVI